MTAVLQALLDRTEGCANVVGRFGAWHSECRLCGLLHLDSHHADGERIRSARRAES